MVEKEGSQLLRIGEVAAQLGIPSSTIRYYEKMGLIEPQRRVSGRRSIDERAIFTLQFIQVAQAAGFTIAEMQSLLESCAKGPNPGGMWNALAKEKKAAVRQQIKALERTDRILTELLNCRCATIKECVQIAVGDPRLEKRVR